MKNNNINELVEAFLQAKNKEDALDLLKGLLTSKELDEIARRLQIVKLLKSGMPQREIVDKLNVGIATVTKGSKEIKIGRFKNI
ncbi:MAG: Trp family transcriptional regulator [Patescibacteria group bacterium]|nr:trp operon repressor [Patescibacteria group bacterium]